MTLTGTNLLGASAVSVSGGGVTVTGITVVNSTTVTANFTIAAITSLSARNVTIPRRVGQQCRAVHGRRAAHTYAYLHCS